MPAQHRSKSKKIRSTRLISYFFLIITTITWGAALIIIKPALDVTTPFRFLFYRYFLAVILSLPLLIYFWPKIKQKRPVLKKIAGLELLGTTAALSLLYYGLDQTSAIEASLITTSSPIFISLLGVLLLKEKVEKRELWGFLITLLGAVVLTLLPIFHGTTQLNGISLTGNLLILAQNLAIGLYYVLAKIHYRQLPKLFVTTISFYIGLSSFFMLSLGEAGWSLPALFSQITADFQAPVVWLASGYMALFGSIIGLTAYIKGQDGIEVSEAALFTYLQPLIYLPLGVLFLQEQLGVIQITALAIILFGVVISEKRGQKKR